MIICLSCEDTVKRPGSEPSLFAGSAGTLTMDCQSLELWKISSCCLSHLECGILFWSAELNINFIIQKLDLGFFFLNISFMATSDESFINTELWEDAMAGWHQRLDGHEFKWTPGVGDGQGGLACCDSWGRKESHTTERMNWTELNWWGMETWLYSVKNLMVPNDTNKLYHKLMQEKKWKCESLSCVQLSATSCTIAHQAPLFMEFSR